MKANKKTKPKQYDKFLGMPAPMWFAFLLMTIFFGATSEYRLRSRYEARIAAYQEREDMYVKKLSQYRDSAETSINVMTEAKYKIRELQERSDFYCDAYQSCMGVLESNYRVKELESQLRYIIKSAETGLRYPKDTSFLETCLMDVRNAATTILREPKREK